MAREHCEYLLEMLEDAHLDRAFASMRMTEGDDSSAPPPKFLFLLSGARSKVLPSRSPNPYYPNPSVSPPKPETSSQFKNNYFAEM